MPSYSLIDLDALARDIGRGAVFYEAGAFAGSGTDLTLTHLGDTEGEIGVEANPEYNDRTLPELSGASLRERKVRGGTPVVTLPLFVADESVFPIVSPIGSGGAGHSREQPVTEYTLVVIPEEVFIEDDAQVALSYDQVNGWQVGGDAATAAQEALLDKSIWFWRGHFEPAVPVFNHDEYAIFEATFNAMHNEDMPEGHKLYTIGRPDQATPAIEIAAS